MSISTSTKPKTQILFAVIIILSFGCKSKFCNKDIATSEIIYTTNFNTFNPDEWVIETNEAGVQIVGNSLEIDAAKGCTVWLKEKLKAPVSISYSVTVMDQGKQNDRVSDNNVFWMAIDPAHPDSLFTNNRTGNFNEYHGLRQYYVGMGGHNNTKTRFRRYTGSGERPLLPEHDLSDSKYLITANDTITILIESDSLGTRYYRNNELIYCITDTAAYTEGWFGFRTVKNRMRIHHFTISSAKIN